MLVMVGVSFADSETIPTSRSFWHNHDVTIYNDEARNPIEAYLGVEYFVSKSLVLGAKGFLDVNNLDSDDLDENVRAEVGATWRFGPGLE